MPIKFTLAIGSGRLKDTGYGGLPSPFKDTINAMWMPMKKAPAGFAQLTAGYRAHHGTSKEDDKRTISHVSWKGHQSGANSSILGLS